MPPDDKFLEVGSATLRWEGDNLIISFPPEMASYQRKYKSTCIKLPVGVEYRGRLIKFLQKGRSTT
jgi:hypothetical protein